jgi:hypothetical protein
MQFELKTDATTTLLEAIGQLVCQNIDECCLLELCECCCIEPEEEILCDLCNKFSSTLTLTINDFGVDCTNPDCCNLTPFNGTVFSCVWQDDPGTCTWTSEAEYITAGCGGVCSESLPNQQGNGSWELYGEIKVLNLPLRATARIYGTSPNGANQTWASWTKSFHPEVTTDCTTIGDMGTNAAASPKDCTENATAIVGT